MTVKKKRVGRPRKPISERHVERAISMPRELSNWIDRKAPRNVSRFLVEIIQAHRRGLKAPEPQSLKVPDISPEPAGAEISPRPTRNYGQR